MAFRPFVLPALCVWVLWGGPAAAQTTEGDVTPGASPTPSADDGQSPVEQAREAFRQGSTLARQGQWTEALEAFEKSLALQRHPVTLYNLGYVERALGHYTRARKMLRAAVRVTEPSALPDELAPEARVYLSEIEGKVARVGVTVEPGVAVAIDGRPLEADEGGDGPPVLIAGTADAGVGTLPGAASFELLVDPGRHVVVLSRAGAPDSVLNRNYVAGGSAKEHFAVELPRPAPARPSATPHAADPSRTWMWISYGVGAAGVVTGSVFGILAIDKNSTLKDQCPKSECPPERSEDLDQFDAFALASTIGFGVGAVGVGAGTYFLLTGGGKETRNGGHGFPARPWFGLGSAGVSGRF